MSRITTIAAAWVLATASGAALAVGSPGDPAAGREKAAQCKQCHGEDGNSTVAQFPRLAGQYADYLARALEDYATGARNNPIMLGIARGLSPQDRLDLAAWFASRKGLTTPKRR